MQNRETLPYRYRRWLSLPWEIGQIDRQRGPPLQEATVRRTSTWHHRSRGGLCGRDTALRPKRQIELEKPAAQSGHMRQCKNSETLIKKKTGSLSIAGPRALSLNEKFRSGASICIHLRV